MVGRVIGIVATVIVGLALVISIPVGLAFGCKAYNRYQARADAGNRVKINHIIIRQQAQRVLIAKQEAQIRFQRSIGIRKAQDEVQKTLTPLYVQFEMTQVLNNIASNGHNNSVVFIPVGANGIPLVSGANGPRVGLPTGSK